MESACPIIGEELVLLSIRIPEGIQAGEERFLPDRHRVVRSFDSAIHEREVQRTIKIEIGEHRSEARAASSKMAQARGGRLILEQTNGALFPKSVLFP